jgi:hypothetical protein
MATATAQQLLDDLDEKVAQLKEAVQALEQASGRVPQPEPTSAGGAEPQPTGDADPDHE